MEQLCWSRLAGATKRTTTAAKAAAPTVPSASPAPKRSKPATKAKAAPKAAAKKAAPKPRAAAKKKAVEEIEDENERKMVYDTTYWSQTNTGHLFGDHLTQEERRAVIEYLKTL